MWEWNKEWNEGGMKLKLRWSPGGAEGMSRCRVESTE